MALNSSHAVFFAISLHGAAAVAQAPAIPPEDSLFDARARDAYLDETARRLVLGLKSVRDTARSDIEAYTALVRERVGVEFPAQRRDRAWMHGARAARIRWSRREPTVVRVLGSRFRDPMLGSGNSRSFSGLRTERFAVDPTSDPFHFAFGLFAPPGEADAPARSPLETGSERLYRFRSGDTVSVRFDGGRTVSAVAVDAIPRYRSVRLVSAIMWIDPDSFRLVRVAYRPAKRIDREMSWQIMADGSLQPGMRFDLGVADPSKRPLAAEAEPASDSSSVAEGLFSRLVNGVFDNAMPRHEADISVVLVDYGLWEMRHWLPRAVRLRGYMRAADVTATEVAPPPFRAMIDWTLEIEGVSERGAEVAAGVPATAADALRLWRLEGDSVSGALDEADVGATVTITPSDREALTGSVLLPPTLWEDDRSGNDDAEIAAELASIGSGDDGDDGIEGPSPWLFDPPGKTLRLLRYNPVERLSVGARLRSDWAWGRATLTARVGTARLEPPDVDLTLQRDRPGHRALLSFYRALRDVTPQGVEAPGVFATGDASDFHWSHGASLRLLPPATDRSWLSLRLFAERDADVATSDRRNRVGAAVAWTPWWGGADVGAVGGGGRATVRVSRGDRPHVRAVLEGAAAIPVSDRTSLGLQVGSARVWGDPATQDLWRIGDNGGWLRGHAEAVRAAQVEMARLDLQRQIGLFRISVFADWASTGDGDYQALGAGLVLMEGAMRLDVARGLGRGTRREPNAVLRLHFWGDAFF